jgi:dTDP-4-dehydrorhamnose 3,5-epimerase
MTRLVVVDLPIPGIKLVKRSLLSDTRGFFSRVFCATELASAGWNYPIVQVNHSYTKRRGTVRGLHYQLPPQAEIKLVSCLRGEVWDVAVDLRQGSPTFLHWHAQTLSADNGLALLIPEGFAHGFQALSDDAELLYCHSAPYVAASEAGLNPQDARLAINWPLPVAEVSARDAGHSPLTPDFRGVAR